MKNKNDGSENKKNAMGINRQKHCQKKKKDSSSCDTMPCFNSSVTLWNIKAKMSKNEYSVELKMNILAKDQWEMYF